MKETSNSLTADDLSGNRAMYKFRNCTDIVQTYFCPDLCSMTTCTDTQNRHQQLREVSINDSLKMASQEKKHPSYECSPLLGVFCV